jgi:hypothetical protein
MGGNAIINGVRSDKIYVSFFGRKQLKQDIRHILENILKSFDKTYTFNDNSFSGSCKNLFDRFIQNSKFIQYNPIIGDIDFQIDIERQEDFISFLNEHPKIKDLTFIGYKRGNKQVITLWNSKVLGLNIQIDFEFETFVNGEPSKWSQFIHSSHWNDCRLGIKGVFSKLLLRAIQHKNIEEICILPRSTLKKPKIISSSKYAFSIYGLRDKLIPVLDKDFNHLEKDGLMCYYELKPSDCVYITDIDKISLIIFPNIRFYELHQMFSFSGISFLCSKHFSKVDQLKVFEGFIKLLWGEGAQKLVRDNNYEDYRIKRIPVDFLAKTLDISYNYNSLVDVYYQN